MAIQVPVRRTPQTQPVAVKEGYIQRRGVDYSGVVQQLGGIAADLKESQTRRQEFDLNKAVLQETNQLAEIYATRTREADLGATNFAENFNIELQSRHQELVKQFQEKGYDKEVLRAFELRLGSIRNSYFGNAINFQASSVKVKADSEFADMGTQASTYAFSNPDAINSVLDELEHNSFLLGVDQPTATILFDRERRVVLEGAKRGLIESPKFGPQYVLDKLNATATPARRYGKSSNPWANVAVDVANKFNLNPVELAAIMSFETGGTFDPNIEGGEGGNYLGLIQFGPNEQKTYGITIDSTPEQWTQAITKFFEDRGLKPGASIEDVYSTILTGSPGNYNRKDINGTNVRNAVPRILSDHLANAEKWLGAIAQEEPTPIEVKEDGTPVTTGDPVLDLLDGQERAQMIEAARAKLRQNEAQVKGAASVIIQNEITARNSGEDYAGQQMTKDEVLSIYGPVEGEVKWAELNAARNSSSFVKNLKTMSATDISARLQSLKPTDTADPGYTDRVQQYNYLSKLVQETLKAREEDPASYIFNSFPNVAEAFRGAADETTRRQAYASMAQAYKQLGIPRDNWMPIPKDQVKALATSYSNMGPDEKLRQLEVWQNDLAGLGLFSPLLRELGDEGTPEAAVDMFMAAQLTGHPQRRGIMLEIFSGTNAIKEDPARKPSESAVNEAYRRVLGESITQLNPTSSRFYNEAAAGIYVNRGGRTQNGVILDQSLYEEALRLAVGGLKDDKNSGIVKLHGGLFGNKHATILPPSVTKKEWNQWLTRLTPGSLTQISREKLPPLTKFGKPAMLEDIIEDGIFVMAAPGQYAIRSTADGGFLKTATGQTYLVNISPRTVRGR